jgi:hypothetical protein
MPDKQMPAPTYKQLSWTVKFTSDLVKVPDITSSTPLVSSYDLPVSAPPATDAEEYTSFPVFQYVPAGNPIMIVVVKVDPASIKDLAGPLRLRFSPPAGDKEDDTPEPTPWRLVTPDGAKNGVAYTGLFTENAIPAGNDWQLDVKNENLTAIDLIVTVAYGPPSK